MRYEKNRDIYDTLEEFINEYSSIENDVGENSRGMDFRYKNERYRICREFDDVFYVYSVKEMPNDNDEFDIIGICNSMDELLSSTFIKGIPFKEIVMDEVNTIIFGKD